LSVEKGAADLTEILPLLAGATVLAFSEGKPENRCLLAIDLVSGAGLESEYAKFVRFDPKVQRILTPMTTPYFILDLWITRLILEVAWDPMNDASSRLAGASLVHIGGVDSVLRISLYILRRMLFVAMSFPPWSLAWRNRQEISDRSRHLFDEQGQVQKLTGGDPRPGWKFSAKFAHRNVVQVQSEGLCCLRSFDSMRSRERFQNVCGKFGFFDCEQIFETARKLHEVIRLVSKMRRSESSDYCVIPPGPYRETYDAQWEKWKNKVSEAGLESLKTSPVTRVTSALWLVRMKCLHAADRMQERLARTLFDPCSFLASSTLTQTVTARNPEDPPLQVATEEARANMCVFYVQINELREHYLIENKNLADFLKGPLKTILADWKHSSEEMKNFFLGSRTIRKSLLKSDADLRDAAYTYPVSAYPIIGKAAFIAASMPVSNNDVESGWSMATAKYRGGCKSGGDKFWSMNLRRPNAV